MRKYKDKIHIGFIKIAFWVAFLMLLASSYGYAANQEQASSSSGTGSIDVRLLRQNSVGRAEEVPDISDIEKLEKYERRVVERLSGQSLLVYGGRRLNLTVEISAGGGMGFAMAGKSSFIKKAFYFDFTLYFGIDYSFLKNFRIFINAGMLMAKFRYQSLKYYVGTDLFINYADDGSLKMFPVVFGLSYKLKVIRWLNLNFAFGGGISFNKQHLPNQPIVVSATTTIPNSVSRSSTDIVFKGWLRAEFLIAKNISASLDIQMFIDKQPAYTDGDTLESKSGTIMMLLLGAQFGYRF